MKKNLKKKISSYGFWISLLTAIFLIVKAVLTQYNIHISNSVAIEIISGICFVLITVGVIKNNDNKKMQNIKEDIENEIDINNET